MILVDSSVWIDYFKGRSRPGLSATKTLTSLTVVGLGGLEIAVQAAKNFRRLRATGVTARKTIDTLIATWCIESGVKDSAGASYRALVDPLNPFYSKVRDLKQEEQAA